MFPPIKFKSEEKVKNQLRLEKYHIKEIDLFYYIFEPHNLIPQKLNLIRECELELKAAIEYYSSLKCFINDESVFKTDISDEIFN